MKPDENTKSKTSVKNALKIKNLLLEERNRKLEDQIKTNRLENASRHNQKERIYRDEITHLRSMFNTVHYLGNNSGMKGNHSKYTPSRISSIILKKSAPLKILPIGDSFVQSCSDTAGYAKSSSSQHENSRVRRVVSQLKLQNKELLECVSVRPRSKNKLLETSNKSKLEKEVERLTKANLKLQSHLLLVQDNFSESIEKMRRENEKAKKDMLKQIKKLTKESYKVSGNHSKKTLRLEDNYAIPIPSMSGDNSSRKYRNRLLPSDSEDVDSLPNSGTFHHRKNSKNDSTTKRRPMIHPNKYKDKGIFKGALFRKGQH